MVGLTGLAGIIDADINDFTVGEEEFDEIAPEDATDYEKCLIRFKNSWRREIGSMTYNEDPRFQKFVSDYCETAYNNDLPKE